MELELIGKCICPPELGNRSRVCIGFDVPRVFFFFLKFYKRSEGHADVWLTLAPILGADCEIGFLFWKKVKFKRPSS